MGNYSVDQPYSNEEREALERYMAFFRSNRERIMWLWGIESEFWKLYILTKEAEAELKYFATKNQTQSVPY